MYRLFFAIILTLGGLNAYSQFRWVYEGKGFSAIFPTVFRDTTYSVKDGMVSKASAYDELGNYFVAECKVVNTTMPDDQYKADWKKYHDKVLADFLTANQLEKTEEERFDIGKYHGIQAILNHTSRRLTFFYRNIIIGNKSITMYVIQPRSALNFKLVKRFYQSARYKISLLK